MFFFLTIFRLIKYLLINVHLQFNINIFDQSNQTSGKSWYNNVQFFDGVDALLEYYTYMMVHTYTVYRKATFWLKLKRAKNLRKNNRCSGCFSLYELR